MASTPSPYPLPRDARAAHAGSLGRASVSRPGGFNEQAAWRAGGEAALFDFLVPTSLAIATVLVWIGMVR